MTLLDIDRRLHEDYAVLSLIGELDMGNVDVLRQSALQVIGDCKPRVLIVNCAQLRFIDSTGLGALVGLHKRLTMTGGQIILANVGGICTKVLLVTGLDRVFHVHWQVGDPIQPWEDGAAMGELLRLLGCANDAQDQTQSTPRNLR